jgi:sporulation protein YunB
VFTRPRPSARRGGEGFFLSAFLGIGLALLLIWLINRQLRPIMTSMATTKVTNAVTRELENAVSDYITSQDLNYNDMVILEKDNDGAVTALTCNMSRLNVMRNTILMQVVDSIDTLDTEELSIPIGNITGISMLSGAGFRLPVQVISVGNAKAAFDQAFSAVGINQTRYQLMLNVTVTVSILIPGGTITKEVTTQVCAAETIIVGGVPETYLTLGQ